MVQFTFSENCLQLQRDGLKNTGLYSEQEITEMLEKYMVIVESIMKKRKDLFGQTQTIVKIDPRHPKEAGLPMREGSYDGGKSPLFLFVKYDVYIGGINIRWIAKALTRKGPSGYEGLPDGLTRTESYTTFGIPKRFYHRDSDRDFRGEDLRKRIRRDEPVERRSAKQPRLEDKISELESKISELKKKISKLDSENSDLKAKNATAFREGATLVSSLSSSQYTFPGYGPPLPPATAYTTGGEQYVPYGSLRIMPQSSHPPSYGV